MGRWTTQGFEAYTVEEYKTQIQSLFVEAFGSDFSLDDSLPQGVLIQRIAELLYNADMDAVEVMSQLNVNTTSGIWLDMIAGLRGLSRGTGSPQIATVTISSSSVPYTIPAGTVFSSGVDIFTNTSDIYITSTPQTNILLAYNESGNSSLQVSGTLTTSASNVTNVVITALTDGQPAETDAELRRRLYDTYNVSNGTVEYVESLIAASPFVKTTGVEYNDTSSTVDSRPPHSTEWMAVPIDTVDSTLFNTTIGEIIVNNKTPGAETYGNTTVTVNDMYGEEKTVKFTIPTAVNLEMEFTVTTPSTGVPSLAGIPDEKIAIAEYVNGLKIHEDVAMSRVLACIINDPGFNVTAYKIREIGSAVWTSNADFTIAGRKYAKISTANITVGTI